MGKTNLLDAIYYACMAKSHNTSSDRDVVNFGKEFFRLEAQVESTKRQHHVVIKVKPGWIKEISVDGKAVDRLSGYVGFIPVIMLTPEDIILIQGGSIARRRFMDFALCQADRRYMEALQRYNRLLVQRNALLKQDGRLSDKDLLMTYTRSMSDPAKYVHESRDAFCNVLLPEVTKYYDLLSDSLETPQIKYQSHLFTRDMTVLAESGMEEDLQNGRTTKGIHRDDLDILLDTRLVKKYGSQGQIKSVLIALHLAQAEFLKHKTGNMPCLLLDDIFDKLDEDRSQRLIGMLTSDVAQQVFVTDASQARVERVRSNAMLPVFTYHILQGRIQKSSNAVDEKENGNLQSNEEE